MDANKLLKTLTINHGQILVPYIDAYQEAGKFPSEWVIRIRNKKTERDHGEADLRFHAGSDAMLSVEQLVSKYTGQDPPMKIGAPLRRSFDAGAMWHEYYGFILVDMGFIDPDGVEQYFIRKIETPKGIAYGSGLGDLVGVRIPEKGEWLVDMKTMKKADFEGTIPKYLFDKYVAQVRMYGEWFGYDKLMILGIEKDTPHRLREWIIPQDLDQVHEIYDRWVEAYGRVKDAPVRAFKD